MPLPAPCPRNNPLPTLPAHPPVIVADGRHVRHRRRPPRRRRKRVVEGRVVVLRVLAALRVYTRTGTAALAVPYRGARVRLLLLLPRLLLLLLLLVAGCGLAVQRAPRATTAGVAAAGAAATGGACAAGRVVTMLPPAPAPVRVGAAAGSPILHFSLHSQHLQLPLQLLQRPHSAPATAVTAAASRLLLRVRLRVRLRLPRAVRLLALLVPVGGGLTGGVAASGRGRRRWRR